MIGCTHMVKKMSPLNMGDANVESSCMHKPMPIYDM